jgi:FHA domain/Double zinc ribbon
MDARFYNSEDIDIERLANDLEQKYRTQGYEVQQIGNKDQMMVQLKKGGDLAALVGMQTALSVIIQRTSGGTVAMIGQQKWIDKAAVGAVGLVLAPVLWPLMLTAGAGAIRQASLGNQVLNEVDWLVRQQKPEVRLGPIPAQAMPQIQQQWAAPPAQYYPAAPVYVPSVPVYAPPAQPPQPAQPAPAPGRSQLRCPNCNTPYEEGDTFCSGCGRTLKTLCPNCKAEIKPGVAFCTKCGASIFQTLSGTQAAISPAPAPAVKPASPPTLYPPPTPRPATPPPAPQQPPQPYVPPAPQRPAVVPQPTITYIPGSSKPPAPPPSPKRPKAPVYTPPAQSVQPTQPAQPAAQPTVQSDVSPGAQTLPAPRQPIKARATSEPAASASVTWGKLIFGSEKEVMLSGEQMLIGRADHDVQGVNPDIDLSDLPGADTTSRIHATIEHVGSLYTITDLNSTNATRINGKRVEPDKATAINDGDTLRFGKVTCTFKKL